MIRLVALIKHALVSENENYSSIILRSCSFVLRFPYFYFILNEPPCKNTFFCHCGQCLLHAGLPRCTDLFFSVLKFHLNAQQISSTLQLWYMNDEQWMRNKITKTFEASIASIVFVYPGMKFKNSRFGTGIIWQPWPPVWRKQVGILGRVSYEWPSSQSQLTACPHGWVVYYKRWREE